MTFMKLKKFDYATWQNKSPMKWPEPEKSSSILEKSQSNQWRSRANLSTSPRVPIKYLGYDSLFSRDRIRFKLSSQLRVSSPIMSFAPTSIWILILKCKSCKIFTLPLRNFLSDWRLCWTTVFSKCITRPKWNLGLLVSLMRMRRILRSFVYTFVSKMNLDTWFILLLILISSQTRINRRTIKHRTLLEISCFRFTLNKRWSWSKEEETTSLNSKK